MPAKTKQTDRDMSDQKSHLSLYRKYRPTSLDQVVGQEGIITALKNSLNSGNFGHAYLFVGPRGTGKTSVARIFAHAVNNFEYTIEDSYLDIVEMDAASNRSIDDIREIKERVIVAPSEGKYKIYIIDEVHMLTREANNALLKTIEEPPEHVIFILATTNIEKVPATILSRTQIFNFQLASPETMQAHLRKISDTEKIKITDDALAIVVRMGGGSFRDSLSILEQVATLSTEEITPEIIESAMGLPSQEIILQLLNAYANSDADQVHGQLQKLYNSGLTAERIASSLVESVCANPSPAFLPLLSELTKVVDPFVDAKLLLALLNFPNNAPQITTSSTTIVATPQTVVASVQTTSQTQIDTAQPSNPPAAESTLRTPVQETKPAQPVATPVASDPQLSQLLSKDFNWDGFLDRVKTKSTGAYTQLSKVEHDFDAGTLHLYAPQSFTKRQLENAKYYPILTGALPNIAIVVHGPDERPAVNSTTESNPQLTQIADIMGNVKEANGGDIPEF